VFRSDPVPGIRRVAVSGTTRRTDVRPPRLLRSILPVHERHSDTRTVRQRSAVRRKRRRLPPLQLPLGRRMRKSQSGRYVASTDKTQNLNYVYSVVYTAAVYAFCTVTYEYDLDGADVLKMEIVIGPSNTLLSYYV